MRFLKQTTLSLVVLSMAITFSYAQKKDDKKPEETKPTTPAPPATPAAKPAEAPKTGPKPYKEVITDKAKTQKGMMTVHKVDEKYYFEIPDSLIGRDIMAVTRFSKTPAGGGIFGGEEVNSQVIRWEKAPDNKIFLRSISLIITSPDTTKPMFQSVRNSSADPIIGAFDIKAMKKDTVSVIEVTDFFKGDQQVFSLDPMRKTLMKLTMLQADRSYIQHIRTYPINTEIRTVKTFSVVPPTPSMPSPVPMPQIGQYFPAGRDAGFVTMEFNTSLLLLPKSPMKKRIFDPRVGYFATSHGVFGEESHKSDNETIAVRWRLEPKNAEDAARQKRGELIEPKKPIVYYIDPATPLKWRPFLKAGIDDWQATFENAGWKNAIRGEYWNEKDSTMSLEDARFSVIRYFAAEIQNAYGPNVHDPRSGEILESHIGWYHNVMRLLRNWYLVQAGAVDKRAQKKDFDDELMGQLVRFVSSHEVGHTLGLRHNMGASSATPVEKLRDKNWVAQNGHTSSIMDYARFNYVAQPEDGVTDLFPRIGDYDKWAIKWGYSNINGADEKKVLNDMTKEALKNPRLRFGTEVSASDPRFQTEDLSDNAMKASEYGIKNLQRILPNLNEWSKTDGESYKELAELYDNVVGQFRRYVGHVAKNVGGIYDTPKTYDMEGSVYEVVPRSTQKEAITFLNNQVFSTPTWLLNQNIISRIRPEQGVEALKSIQESALNNVFASDKMVRLLETGSQNASNYSVDELMTDVRNGIMSELKSKKTIDIHRRNLQKVYVEKLISMLSPMPAMVMSIPPGGAYNMEIKSIDLKKTDLPSIVRGHLESLKNEIRVAIPLTTDKLSKYHLQDIYQRITKALDPK